MNVLIIEDEEIAAKNLVRKLLNLDSQINIVAILESVEESIAFFKEQQQPDLLLLDIHLSDGISFEIFQNCEITCPVIFTTAYDQYAIKAFELNSIDYLLKPVKDSDLKKALDKFKKWQSVRLPDIQELLSQLSKSKENYQRRFLVNHGNELIFMDVDEVAYFYGEGKYVYLYKKDGKQHIVDFTLNELESRVDPFRFYRANRQLIISAESIYKMIPYPKSRLKLELNPPQVKEIFISSDKGADFKRWLNK